MNDAEMSQYESERAAAVEGFEPIDPDDFEALEEQALDDLRDFEAEDYGAYWNEIEQGMYDDDPSPYHGDYSEM